MSKVDIIRAWRDEDYRLSLTEAERALLPAHPAGLIELDKEQMQMVMGAGPTFTSCGGGGRCTCPPP
jgi:mersacidin/lichenicidin family type 2 lantibiotic